MKVQVGRWGNSLAVRLPKAFVERFGIGEGRELDLAALETALEAEQQDHVKRGHDTAIQAIRERAWIPGGFRFDREEMYDALLEERHGKL